MLIFYSQLSAIAFTLLIIYVTLKWFRLEIIRRKARAITEPDLRRRFIRQQCAVRIILLDVGIIIDGLAFFFADYSTALWLSLMLALCFFFVYPSKKRVESEYTQLYPEEQ